MSLQASDSDDLVHDGLVTIEKWALTRRQVRLKDTSFETASHDIYAPVFSS